MSRESVLKRTIEPLRNQYDVIIADCMPSLGMMTINALVAADSVIIPCEPSFLSVKGLDLLLHSISRIKRQINPNLKIDYYLGRQVDCLYDFDEEYRLKLFLKGGFITKHEGMNK